VSTELAGKCVLVTGGTGFIGGRLVERLVLEQGAKVRVLVHNFAHASRIARFPVEMVAGDVTRLDDVRAAAQGCQVIFHCAYGNAGNERTQRRINVCGTENVMQAALAVGAPRVVYTSTLSVYGLTQDGDLDETAPRRYSRKVYGDSKLDAERIAWRYAEDFHLPVVIIQPTVVYGPYAPWWTVHFLRELKKGKMILVNGGDGLCNAVYVDDVVSALMLAAVKPEAVGEAFLVSAEQPVTWRDFFGAYERMLGVQATVPMSAAEARAYYRQQQKHNSTVRRIVRMLRENHAVRTWLRELPAVAGPYKFIQSRFPESRWEALKARLIVEKTNPATSTPTSTEQSIPALDPWSIEYYSTKTRVRIDKAKRLLGYLPAFDLEQGMQLTKQWAKWAKLLD